jgi:hypothetical protein
MTRARCSPKITQALCLGRLQTERPHHGAWLKRLHGPQISRGFHTFRIKRHNPGNRVDIVQEDVGTTAQFVQDDGTQIGISTKGIHAVAGAEKHAKADRLYLAVTVNRSRFAAATLILAGVKPVHHIALNVRVVEAPQGVGSHESCHHVRANRRSRSPEAELPCAARLRRNRHD